MSRLLWMTLLLLLPLSVSAQDGLAEQTFSLRQPSAEEYISAIPEILNQWHVDIENDNFPPKSIITILSQETHKRYAEELRLIDPEILFRAFQLLNNFDNFEADRDLWMNAILLAWLEQNHIDLDTLESFTIEDVDVQVSPRDFNNDGQDEYLLNLRSDLYSQLIVIKSTDSGYEIVDSPLPWYGCCFMYYSNLSGFMEEQYFGDLNGNGTPEWVLAEGGIGGGHMHHGELFVLEWRDGKFVDISANGNNWWDIDVMTYRSAAGGGAPLFPWGVELSFKDIDANNTIDIVIQQEFNDSWSCISKDTRIFSWDEDSEHYYLNSHTRDFEDSAECNLRQAQDKIWDKDYSGAIPLLVRSVELYEQKEFDDEINKYVIDLADAQKTYSRVRLALAYVMTDDMASANATLSNIDEPLVDFLPINNFAEVAKQSILNNPDKMTFCVSLYNVFADFYQDWGANPYWGATGDISSPWAAPNSQAPEANPATAGCDAISYVDDALQAMPSTTLEYVNDLKDSNLPISSYYQGDLNSDFIDDWLVWLDIVDSDPILFLSSPEGYQATHLVNTALAEPNSYTHWFEWQLPDNTDVWGVLYFDDEHTFDELISDFISSGGGGPFAYCLNRDGDFNLDLLAGDIALFRLTENNDLERIFSAKICEPVTLDYIFPEGIASTELFAWKRSSERNTNSHYSVVAAIYIWNEEAGTYISANEESIQSTAIPQENDELEEVYLDTVSVLKAVDDNEFEAVIYLINDYLSNVSYISDFSNNATYTAYYYRAFAYEQLGQFDEALADYVTLYTEAPTTAWGMLAGLHIEPTSKNKL